MDYTTIAASIEQARADIKVQIGELRERDVALEQSLTWAAIAYGIDADGEPITVEGEGSGRCVNCDHDDHYGERCDGVCDDGPACACSWPDAGNFTVVGVPGPAVPGTGGGAGISADPGNRATAGSDGGVYVRDDLVPDPLAYYILAKA